MATINLFRIRQERGQSPQNFSEQFTTIRQVCEKLGLHSGQSDQEAQAILKKEGVTSPTTERFEEVTKRLSKEYLAILFLYLANQQRYGKIPEDMESQY